MNVARQTRCMPSSDNERLSSGLQAQQATRACGLSLAALLLATPVAGFDQMVPPGEESTPDDAVRSVDSGNRLVGVCGGNRHLANTQAASRTAKERAER
jgi:hypothetical protein